MAFTNSPLATYKNLTKNCSNGRGGRSLERITPHCIVGQWTARQGADYFATTDRQSSPNYVIGKTGDVALSVEEKNRSWCTSSKDNDDRAITIECASDATHPYAMTSAVYETLIALCADICKRYGKTKLLWFDDKDKALNYKPASDELILTVHRWFANKACPGDWLYDRLGDVAAKVTALLGKATVTTTKPVQKPVQRPAQKPTFKPYLVNVTTNGLNIRKGPGTNFAIVGVIKNKGIYTIVDEATGAGAKLWGKLKSGAGWISLDFTHKR